MLTGHDLVCVAMHMQILELTAKRAPGDKEHRVIENARYSMLILMQV